MTDPANLTRGPETLIGRILADRYRIDALLGLGAMGAVFRGHQLTLKRDVAIKVLHPELLQDEQIAKRFEREAESAARLEHPNIVQVLEQGVTDDGHKFIVMQLLEGGELADRLDHPLPAAQATVWAIQILAALEHAHAHGIIHRDLKPENVFVSFDHDGREILKLVDFGIAKIVGGSDSGVPMTKLGLVFGTPAYMSPEQATGVEIDERTDLYSAGIILYQMLAGAPPFRNADPVALIRMQVSVDPPALPDDVPPELSAIVFKLLAKHREERFSSAEECHAALAALLPTLDLEGVAIPSHIIRDISGIVSPASAPMSFAVGDPPRRPARVIWLVAAVAFAGAGAGAWSWWSKQNRRDEVQTSTTDAEQQTALPAADVGHAPGVEFEAIDRLLLAKSPDPALGLIRPLRDEYPHDPRLAWREGKALALKKGMRAAALVRYGEALDADAELIADADFYGELYDLLEDRRLRSDALDFALQRLGKNGHKFLLGRVNEKNPDRALHYDDRRRALAQLTSDPTSNALIDHRLNLARDLWQAPQALAPCTAFRDALMAMALAPDQMYLATLRSRGLPKPPTDEQEARVCDARLLALREAVVVAYEAAYATVEGAGEAGAGEEAGVDGGTGVAEPTPESTPTSQTSPKASSGKKKSPSSKPTSSQKKSTTAKKKKDPFEKVGDKLDKLFGG